MNREHRLDHADRCILALLEENARRPNSDIARHVGLSPASVADRIARMCDTGVISGFTTRFDAANLGFDIAAIVQFEPNSFSDAEGVRKAATHPAVRSCYKVLGDFMLTLVVRVRSTAELNVFLLEINEHGKTKTSVVLSSELEDRPWFAKDTRDAISVLRRKDRGH